MTEAALFITIAIYWLAVAALFGVAEAYYFYHLNQAYDKRGRDYDHALLTALRGSIAAPLLLLVYLQQHSLWHCTIILLYMLCAFPFIHDGVYYTMRNRLHKGTYPDGWRSNTNVRALLDLTYNQRLWAFIAAIITLTIQIILL